MKRDPPPILLQKILKVVRKSSAKYAQGYEPADLTVHPPPRTAEGGFIFFV